MDPVADQVDAEQDLEELQHQRLCRDRLLEIELHRPRERNLHRDQRRERNELHARVADEEVLEIGLPAGAENLLVRMQRPHPLHRDEQQAEHEQFQHEVVEPGGEGARLVRQRLDLAAAHQRGDHRKADAHETVRLRPDQQHRQGAEHERGDDGDLQRSAQQADVLEIVRPRVIGHEYVREHEAQLGQDAEDAQDPGCHSGALADVDAAGRRNLVEQHGR